MTPILECKNLSKSYRKNTLALNNLSIRLERGRIIGLLGPNGSGKTTLIKLAAGLLSPTSGEILIDGKHPGVETKALISYLPDRSYLDSWKKVSDLIHLFEDFYPDFSTSTALDMLQQLSIHPEDRLNRMSKGTKEKVELILVMSRNASLYLLDEPIGGVDPAARDYILSTILRNYHPESTILLSTHLITDVESILDDVIFIKNGEFILYDSVDHIRETEHNSVDGLFKEVFRC